MQWQWSGPDIVLAIATTTLTIVTTFISLLVSTVAAVLIALWIQRREFDRETVKRRVEREEQRDADRVAWRVRMADEGITFCVEMQVAAMDAGNAYATLMVERHLDAFQARLRLGDDVDADHVAVAMRRDWEHALWEASRLNAPNEREAPVRGVILRLEGDLQRWDAGDMATAEWAARGIGG